MINKIQKEIIQQQNKTQEEILQQVANEKMIKHPELFICFMVARFPNERHTPYIREWADRFLSCNPMVDMDTESKKCYLEVVKNNC